MPEKSKIITLWSPFGNTGCSFTALALAQKLARQGKVAVLDFNLKQPSIHLYCASEDRLHTLDNLIPYAAGGTLTPEIFAANMQVFGDFVYLRGTSNPYNEAFQQRDFLNLVLSTAKSLYDYVIVDTYNLIDNMGTYVALAQADIAIVVVEKNALILQQYEAMRQIVEENFELRKFILLVNRVQSTIYMDKETITEFFGIGEAYEAPLLDASFINALNQRGDWRSFLLSEKAKQYETAIHALAQRIEPSIETVREQKRGWKLFNRN